MTAAEAGATSARDEVVPALSAEVFAGLSRRVKRELAAAAKVSTFEKGRAIYRAGETSDTVIVVLEGELSVRCDGGLGEDFLAHVGEGEITGIEALVGLTRRGTARAILRTRIAALSAPLLRRTLARHAGEGALAQREARLLLDAMADLLGRVPLGDGMSAADRAELAAVMIPKRVARGERFARAGEVATTAFVVIEGLVEVRAAAAESSNADGPAANEGAGRTIAFLSRGDIVDDEAILAGQVRAHDLLANGDSLVAELPAREVRRLHLIAPRALARARRVDVGEARDEPALPFATRHAFRDLYRLHVARSLLVIDLETCVGCGHCAYSCASLHGVARIVRRGDALVSRDADARARTLLLPSSCQHCELPSCMPACPTGAIGRDASGEVSIREELCTGCEACARACPWDNIQMGPRDAKAAPIFLDGTGAARIAGQSASVAVKCDLCRGFEVSACVDGCPVDAIVRLSPEETTAVPEASALGEPAAENAPTLLVPPARLAWPFVLSAAIVSAGLSVWADAARRSAHLGPARGLGLFCGVLAAALLAWLWGYALRKRLVRAFVRRGERRPGARSSVRAHTIAHFAIGVLLPGIVCVHSAAFTTRTSGGVLSIALAVATVAGALAASSYALLPPRIAKLSPTARLLDDVPRERKLLEDRLFRELSGRGPLVKKIAERVLLPYQRAFFGPVALLIRGRSRQEERAALAAHIDAVLEGRGRDKRGGLDALLRTVVEERALRASTILSWGLAAALPLHVVPSAFVLALLLAHVVEAFAR